MDAPAEKAKPAPAAKDKAESLVQQSEEEG